MKKCPQCGLINHDTALRCGCEYELQDVLPLPEEEPGDDSPPAPRLHIFRWLAILSLPGVLNFCIDLALFEEAIWIPGAHDCAMVILYIAVCICLIASAPPRPFVKLALIVTTALLNTFLFVVLPYFAALAVGLSRLHG